MRPLQLGTRVVVLNKGSEGKLRYLGTIEGTEEKIWAGVELDEAVGRNDGNAKGRRYFQCPENHGLFVDARRVQSMNLADIETLPGQLVCRVLSYCREAKPILRLIGSCRSMWRLQSIPLHSTAIPRSNLAQLGRLQQSGRYDIFAASIVLVDPVRCLA